MSAEVRISGVSLVVSVVWCNCEVIAMRETTAGTDEQHHDQEQSYKMLEFHGKNAPFLKMDYASIITEA